MSCAGKTMTSKNIDELIVKIRESRKCGEEDPLMSINNTKLAFFLNDMFDKYREKLYDHNRDLSFREMVNGTLVFEFITEGIREEIENSIFVMDVDLKRLETFMSLEELMELERILQITLEKCGGKK